MFRVLLIDDSEVLLEVTRRTLVQAGFEVATSSNPLLLPAKLREFKPNLVLLDVDMPTIRGPDALGTLRKNDCLQGAKVVLYSGSSDEELLARLAMSCGAVAAIHKSVKGQPLVDRLSQLLTDTNFGETGPFKLPHRLAAVVIARPEPERRLVASLRELGIRATPRGAVGLVQILQETFDIALLDEHAFAGKLDAALERLRGKHLTDPIGILVVGESQLADACVREGHTPQQLERAIHSALGARQARLQT